MHKVVKPFPYSVDGFTLVDLVVGDERDFGAMAVGLVKEGWIEPAGKAAAKVDAPLEMAVNSDADEKPKRGRPATKD